MEHEIFVMKTTLALVSEIAMEAQSNVYTVPRSNTSGREGVVM